MFVLNQQFIQFISIMIVSWLESNHYDDLDLQLKLDALQERESVGASGWCDGSQSTYLISIINQTLLDWN